MGTSRKGMSTPGVVGYVRVSTDEQASSGLGLSAQRSAIEAESKRRGLALLSVYEDAGLSAKNMDRPGLNAALTDLCASKGTILMVAKLDRLTRSVHDATGLMIAADKAGFGLVALDVAVDTTTPQGAAMAQVLAVFAELERRFIGERTKAALAAKKAQGVKLGRPATLPPDVVRAIIDARNHGNSWPSIARMLDDAQVPTAQGGQRWYPATVRAVYIANAEGEAA